ncbi:VOC family protein [Cryptosporangium sp. NPDC048952]|uniref:VOC family protein n=1 Tax=Cryptosporangium sp. NPDC048952 TaxID=3363961 RepID=UPI003718A845
MTILVAADAIPDQGAVLNPFVIVDDAAGFVTFVAEVFGVPETVEARTPLPSGQLIHAQLRLGTVDLMLADRLDGWPARPGLLQVWVSSARTVLDRAGARGATTITEPTPFYGETTLARMADSWGNLWWLYEPAPGQPDPVPSWEGGSNVVFTSLDSALRELGAGSSGA